MLKRLGEMLNKLRQRGGGGAGNMGGVMGGNGGVMNR